MSLRPFGLLRAASRPPAGRPGPACPACAKPLSLVRG